MIVADYDFKTSSPGAAILTTPDHPANIGALKTALLAVNGGASYTAARLNTMTYNDLCYAYKVAGLTSLSNLGNL